MASTRTRAVDELDEDVGLAARGGLGTSQEKATNHYKQNGANSRGIVSMRRSTLNQEDSFHEEIHPVFQAF